MSRAFGYCECLGLSREPVYKNFEVKKDEELYAMVGTAGIWKFMDAADVLKLAKLKIKAEGANATLEHIVTKVRGDYLRFSRGQCADITAILVQWNSRLIKASKES